MKELNITGGINTLLSRGAVKSVQRGFFNGVGNYIHEADILSRVTVSFSEIDVTKSILLIEYIAIEGLQAVNYIKEFSLNSTSFTIGTTIASAKTRIIWQVIEFY